MVLVLLFSPFSLLCPLIPSFLPPVFTSNSHGHYDRHGKQQQGKNFEILYMQTERAVDTSIENREDLLTNWQIEEQKSYR